jgi:cyclopropane-fatty-acyl-phospholipid synthase
MFEHMRNFDLLLSRIASWLNPGGKLLVHIFCHRVHAYDFDTEGAADWMGRYFFTGGIMPSAEMLKRFGDRMRVTKHFMWTGSHYQRTSEAWLRNLDRHRDEVIRAFTPLYGSAEARRWLHRWRMFFLAVAELFGYENGEEWYVSHYLMEPAR